MMITINNNNDDDNNNNNLSAADITFKRESVVRNY
jgi:hypothetical protein